MQKKKYLGIRWAKHCITYSTWHEYHIQGCFISFGDTENGLQCDAFQWPDLSFHLNLQRCADKCFQSGHNRRHRLNSRVVCCKNVAPSKQVVSNPGICIVLRMSVTTALYSSLNDFFFLKEKLPVDCILYRVFFLRRYRCLRNILWQRHTSICGGGKHRNLRDRRQNDNEFREKLFDVALETIAQILMSTAAKKQYYQAKKKVICIRHVY